MKFIAYWDGHIYEDESLKFVPFEFFKEDRGYNEDDIKTIYNLDLWNPFEVSEGHWVIKIRLR